MKLSRNILLPIALFLFVAGSLYAQDNPQADSLIALLGSARGEERVDILLALVDNESLSEEDRIDYAEKAIELSTQLKNTKKLVDAHLKLGYIYYVIALESFGKAYDESKEANYTDGMANALIRTGRVYNYTGDTEAALDNFMQARDLVVKEKNHLMIGRTFYYIGDF